MSEEATLIFVGVVQLVIGISIGLLYHYLRRDVVNTREYWRGHEEGVAFGRALYSGRSIAPVPPSAATDCLVGGCRWGDSASERCECTTFLCDICETIQPKSDEGPTGSDGLVWCRDCHSEAQP